MYHAQRQGTKVLQEARSMSNNGLHITQFTGKAVTIREAASADLPALRRVAERDSARMIDRPAVVALSDGEVRAALSLSDGSMIADPFHRTTELVEMLRAHARAVNGSARRGTVLRRESGRRLEHRLVVARLRRAV
jgi:hypothetical protein